jgi:hypothetical protein
MFTVKAGWSASGVGVRPEVAKHVSSNYEVYELGFLIPSPEGAELDDEEWWECHWESHMAGPSRVSGPRVQPKAAPVTQAYMGANQMLQRLTAQTGSEEMAKKLLIQRGHMTENGAWTAAGAARNAMTAAERAKDRASKATGLPTTHFKYDPKTNRATKR